MEKDLRNYYQQQLSSPLLPFDKILCLDSIYHYNTRIAFLRQSYNLLRKGGKIGMTDIILVDYPRSSSSLQTFLNGILQSIVCKGCSIPRSNMVTRDQYISSLEEIGFKNIQITCIEDQVWGGFISFLDRHISSFGSLVRKEHWIPYKVWNEYDLIIYIP